MAKKNLTWLYHAEHEPVTVPLDDRKQLKELAKKGWKDSPAKVDKKKEPENLTRTQDVDDSQRLHSELLPRYKNDPESMTKEELVELGNLCDIKVYKMWGRKTIINKLNEKI